MKFHKLSNIFPLLNGQEFDQLVDDIKAHGLKEEIVTYQDQILDGRNRFNACKAAKIEPKFRQYKGKDPLSIVISLNLIRRHLTSGQRATVAKKILPHLKEKAKQNQVDSGKFHGKGERFGEKIPKPIIAKDEAAKILKTNRKYIDYAEEIEDNDPELYKKVESGKINIEKAYKEIKKEKRKKEIKSNSLKFESTNEIKLLEGNLFDQIKNIKNKSVDLILTDPPYFMNKGEWDTFKNKEEFLKFTKKWIKVILPKLKDNYNVFITFNSDYFCDLEFIIREFELPIQSRLIWNYRNAGGKSSGKNKFSKTYEPILHIGNKELNFDDTWTDERFDVWTIAIPQSNFKEGKYHTTQKPIELFNRLVKLGSMENDLILDCFAGSGTSGIVCKNLKRNCVLIEKEKKYIEIIKGRLYELERKRN